ncbi:MAG: electron transfer flavoprotein subunit alpha/FixB family protein [Clostridiaceae bacterium]|jgi:electron transfer flavoprotein alpha subunit|nr:electron transfer flavoprotein subunit alpha/FixB family protein [Clostridiaceae bacterium]
MRNGSVAPLPGGLWVLAEHDQGRILPVVFELLGRARLLADRKGCPVAAVLPGPGDETVVSSLIAAGADEVLACADPTLAGLPEDPCTDLLAHLVRQHAPEIFLLGATAWGRTIAPRVAARVQTGLTADCTMLDIDPQTGLLLQTRPAFGGNLLATIVTERHRPQMATVRPGVLPEPVCDTGRCGRLLIVQAPPLTNRLTELVRLVLPPEQGIASARVIVSAGRGIMSQKNLALVRILADLLGGQMGVSRPLVDMGWAPVTCQIGQTGQSVAPDLLIACGISGAIQHIAGLGQVRTLVAINTDPEAPIFQVADYQVVADCVPLLRQLVRDFSGRQSDGGPGSEAAAP